MTNNIALIIQARVGSTRLPHKILIPFFQRQTILSIVVEKLLSVSDNVIIATSLAPQDDAIEKEAQKLSVPCFRGSETDVLNRFIGAAEAYAFDKMIRVCADNPFLDVDSLKQLLAAAEDSSSDYISFKIDGKPSILTHFGFWAEFVTLKTLKHITALTDENLYHEHVTNYIYNHPNLFDIQWLDAPPCVHGRKNIRLTIDTQSDFDNAQQIYAALCGNHEKVSIPKIIAYLDANPEYYIKMKAEITNNQK